MEDRAAGEAVLIKGMAGKECRERRRKAEEPSAAHSKLWD